MKAFTFSLCLLALRLPLSAANEIEVEAKFLKANASLASIPHDFDEIRRTDGVELLSSPRVTTPSGQRATVEVTREFTPLSTDSKGFEAVSTGVIFDVTPAIEAEHLTYHAHVTMRDLIGVRNDGGQKVSEIVSHELYLSGTPADNEWIWLDLADATAGEKRMVCLRFIRKKD